MADLGWNATNATGEVSGLRIDHSADTRLGRSLQTSWLLFCTFLVVSMQLGFAMIEVGSVREAHRMTVLVKNAMDSAVSCLVFALATDEIFWASSLVIAEDGTTMYSHLLFNWAFCATCVTICSGAMAERTHIIGYLTHAALMAGVIFPPLAEAVWGTAGFLQPLFLNSVQKAVYHDCAGSGVVHLVGGTAALAGNMLLGRRIMRNEEWLDESPHSAPPTEALSARTGNTEKPQERWQRRFDNADRDRTEFQACNYLQVMGMFILWVGWYGFNAGAILTTERGSAHSAGLVAWNSTCAAASGGLGACLYLYGFRLNLDVGFLCNGLLAGLVSITACCDVTTPTFSMLIGLIAGAVVYPITSNGMRRLRLDDPVDAVPVHAAAGLFGVLVVGLSVPDCAVLREKGMSEAQSMFCSEDHDIGNQLLAQLLGALVCIVWTFVISYAFWLFLAAAECVKALELEQVHRAEQLVRELTSPGSMSKSKVHQDLGSAAHMSRSVRRALKDYGWTGNSFQGDLVNLLGKLQQLQFGSLETALEVEMCGPLRLLVGCWKSSWLCRELAVARLRIHPWAEISGLGAAETDGGRLYSALQNAYGQIAELRQQTHAEPLQNEVRELGMLVRSQDILLRRLVNRRYSNLSSSSSRRLRHIPEQFDPERGLAVSLERLPQDQPESQLSTARSLRSGLSSRTAWQEGGFGLQSGFRLDLPSETASTVSDASIGLSPHSVSTTPPPTIHGRVQPTGTVAVAEQLVQMLQMQQQLLSSIGAPPVQANPQLPHAQLLAQALQQVADQASPASSSRRSSVEPVTLGDA